jgi:hypothetical protein
LPGGTEARPKLPSALDAVVDSVCSTSWTVAFAMAVPLLALAAMPAMAPVVGAGGSWVRLQRARVASAVTNASSPQLPEAACAWRRASASGGITALSLLCVMRARSATALSSALPYWPAWRWASNQEVAGCTIEPATKRVFHASAARIT